MSGLSVSNGACIGTDNYTFTLSASQNVLSGFASAVPMTLVRGPGESCFVGIWSSGGSDYLAHISAAPFVPTSVPTLGTAALVSIAGALALAAALARRRRAHAAQGSGADRHDDRAA